MFLRATRVAVLGAVALASGCALTTDRIDIGYTPQLTASPVPGASEVTVSVQVIDDRQDKSKVSSKKNGFGMEMAPIIASEDVSITIRKAIETELANRGFKLGTDRALVQVVADLTRFYNDHKVGFFAGNAVADLTMSVNVKAQDGSALYHREIVAQGIESNTQVAGGNNARNALEKALQDAMLKLFDDNAFIDALTRSAGK
jgi:uncharacterized lipoprotein